MKNELVKDLPNQVIEALTKPFILREAWTQKTWDSFLTSKLSEVKDKLVEMNKGINSFYVVNRTDKIMASMGPTTLYKQIDFVKNYLKRYLGQAGMYRTNNRDLIPATEVMLAIWPSRTPIKFD